MKNKNKREYRLLERNNIFDKDKRFFPQIKTTTFFGLIKTWNKIAKHVDGYGLYPDDDYKFPKTEKEATQICRDFEKWIDFQETTVNIIHPITL